MYIFFNLGCLEDYKKFLKFYENQKPKDVDLKKFENDANELMVKILKYFEKNSLGDKS